MAGFLEKLWDETVAGPTPDSGVGSLRSLQSHDSLPISSSVNVRPKLPVSRSITLLRTRSLPVGPGSDPSSPVTPGTPTEDNMMRSFTRKKPPTMEPIQDSDPRSPTVYDWFSFSLLLFVTYFYIEIFGFNWRHIISLTFINWINVVIMYNVWSCLIAIFAGF